jgi:hypothetical protein
MTCLAKEAIAFAIGYCGRALRVYLMLLRPMRSLRRKAKPRRSQYRDF